MSRIALPDSPVLHWRDLHPPGKGESCGRMRARRAVERGALIPVGGRTGLYINPAAAADTPAWRLVLLRLAPDAILAGVSALAHAGWASTAPTRPSVIPPPGHRALPALFSPMPRARAEYQRLRAQAARIDGLLVLPPAVALVDLLRHAPRLLNTLSLSLPDDFSLDQARRLAR